jgi:hypothetical protein
MKLNEMNLGKKASTKKALKEHFQIDLNFDKMGMASTKQMLKKVRGLISETKMIKESHSRHQNPAYMKLVMMEQALASHYSDLRVEHRIMMENEEVQKSQVILAAQDMIDSIQKMMEQISKMKVEELPAVVTGINNEIGTNEGTQFDQSVGTALGTLEQSLTAAKTELTNSLGQITGAAPVNSEGFGGEQQPEQQPGQEELGGQEFGEEEFSAEELPEPDMEEPR